MVIISLSSILKHRYTRGLAGTCLVYKIAGALARKGASLDEVYNTAQWISSRLATIGVGLEHCHVSISAKWFTNSAQHAL